MRGWPRTLPVVRLVAVGRVELPCHVVLGVAEPRNRGYGTGHAVAGARVGLHTRHAYLALGAAHTWCQLMIDTFADPTAPWRHAPTVVSPTGL